jgi:hypothetical protein
LSRFVSQNGLTSSVDQTASSAAALRAFSTPRWAAALLERFARGMALGAG